MLASDEDGGSLDDLKFSLASDIVELVVLTSDEAFLQTLREAVGGARRLWHVPTADKVPDLLVAGEVGILVLDVTALNEAAEVFVREIKRQFPDLVVVVAGNRDTEVALAPLISAGTVYRFIHKPMSPNRARLFVEAAVKRHGEQRRRALPAPVARPPKSGKPWLIGAGVGAVGAIVVASIALHGGQQKTASVAARTRDVALASPLLAKASQALAQNRLIDPPGDNAFEFYQQILAQSPTDTQALAGIAEVRERLLATAENALLEERLDEAAAAIEAARRAGVQAGRISFLSAQLTKSREQLRTVQAARARAETKAQTPAADTAGTQTSDKATTLIDLANARLNDGHLLEPEHDSAWYYLSEALSVDPQNNAAAETKSLLGMRILSEARSAIDRREFTRASDWIESASGIASAANIETSQALLSAARKQAQSDANAQLLKNGNERLQQDQLIEPENDNAKYYLLTLRGLDAAHPGLPQALSELGARFVAKARLALTLKQYAAARSWLDDAMSVGFASAEGNSVAHELEVTLDRDKFLSTIVPASRLTLQKSVAPAYPAKASAARIEGWVELDYTVTAEGSVADIAVHGADPPQVFEDAAIKAVAQWRYAPPAQPARTRVRIRFTLPK
ncbi:MAG TPA: energy transducer TonB [Steroidobacteraceae bacterium]